MTAIAQLQRTLSVSGLRIEHVGALLIRDIEAGIERLRDSLRRSWAAAAEIDQSFDRRNEDLRQLMAVGAPRLP
ncbi:hypothetical protein [Sinomonas sp. ASV322]|uniref:hypothetical protein n=1 Tax=Sinomonas sp. ASV322 TaxID=3041920 RepID=UPI0027DD0597|nr:hypothetical protein [Sinomonas sp. ASV322]MDQ4504598.1 hypothetical protein [Sinomonas sp. ASV322]